MTTTSTATATWTHTSTRAQVNHFGMKIGAEMRNVFVKAGLMTEEKAMSLRDDICAYLSRGYAKGVRVQLLRGSVVEFELRFTLEQWDGGAVDQRGRGYLRPATASLSSSIRVETTDRFDNLAPSEKQQFYDSLQGSWSSGASQTYSQSHSWSIEARHHVHTGSQLRRLVFGAG